MRTLTNTKTLINSLTAGVREVFDGYNNLVEYGTANSDVLKAARDSSFIDTLKGEATVNSVVHTKVVELFETSNKSAATKSTSLGSRLGGGVKKV